MEEQGQQQGQGREERRKGRKSMPAIGCGQMPWSSLCHLPLLALSPATSCSLQQAVISATVYDSVTGGSWTEIPPFLLAARTRPLSDEPGTILTDGNLADAVDGMECASCCSLPFLVISFHTISNWSSTLTAIKAVLAGLLQQESCLPVIILSRHSDCRTPMSEL